MVRELADEERPAKRRKVISRIVLAGDKEASGIIEGAVQIMLDRCRKDEPPMLKGTFVNYEWPYSAL